MVDPFIRLLLNILEIYKWILIIMAVMSWLVSFNVINTTNKYVYMAMDFMRKITEPVLRPIRRILPDLGGIDISPVIVILLIIFLQDLLATMMFRY